MLNAKPVARLAREMEKSFPLLDFTCWSTEQIRSYGHLLLARFVTFVHTERDAMASVADRLRDDGYDIHLNPRGAAARQFAIRERTLVVRPKPTTQPHEGHLVTVEGLLVSLPKPPKSRRARKPEPRREEVGTRGVVHQASGIGAGGFLNVELEDDRRIEIGVHHQSPRA